MFLSKNFIILIIIFILVNDLLCSETLSPKNRGNKKKKEEKSSKKLPKPIKGPQKYSVLDQRLVSEDILAEDILTNHQAFFTETDDYNFNGLVLGYVTPWNNHGYDVAKIFGNKFTHISPVWLQIKRNGVQKYEVTGTHDVDQQWIVDVKNAGRQRKTKVVPRILFDGWTSNDFKAVLLKPEEVQAMNVVLMKICKKYNFDGYVFEVWSQIAGAVKTDPLLNLILSMSDAFSLENLDFILVIPPKRGDSHLFTEKHFDTLYDHVTAFSLMTYDYSNPRMPGPNAPINWIEDSIISLTSNITRRPKILMGLNFYGNDYTADGGGPIVGHEYIERLKKVPDLPLKFSKEFGEHFFEYKDNTKMNHLVFYPTLYSIFQRLDLAFNLNVGIAIWEIGQGIKRLLPH
ncbi:hypothetical protein ABEB36_009003 [Hypothenemus hampei]|uniref:Chitinase domain-containing protein 1 n=1 Tax=Hypothenemus hampei TaxID=57062 RepID=A0ABD1ENT1_HYPHA